MAVILLDQRPATIKHHSGRLRSLFAQFYLILYELTVDYVKPTLTVYVLKQSKSILWLQPADSQVVIPLSHSRNTPELVKLMRLLVLTANPCPSFPRFDEDVEL